MCSVHWTYGIVQVFIVILLSAVPGAYSDEYSIIVSTKKGKFYGTSDHVHMTINGTHGHTDSFLLSYGTIEDDSTKWFTVHRLQDVGTICGISLKIANLDGWFIDTVQILNMETLRGAKFIVNTLIDGDDNPSAKQSVTKSMPINGGWGGWGSWKDCDGKQGMNGTQERTRVCDAPRPGCGGRMCVGEGNESRICSPRPCQATTTTTTTTTTTVTSVTTTPNGTSTKPPTTTSTIPTTTINIYTDNDEK